MHRELLSAPHIGSYSTFLLFGLVGGYLLLRWRAVKLGIRGSHVDNLGLLIAVASLFGARFFSWLFYFPAGSNFWSAMTSTTGGMVFYGGVVFGAAAAILYARFNRLPVDTLLDAGAPALALGLAIGRIGCYLAGCCWGDICTRGAELAAVHNSQVVRQVWTFPGISSSSFPLAVSFPPQTGPFEQHVELGLIDPHAERSLLVHPVQLYEAALALLLCMGLHWGFHCRQSPGQVACWFAFGYAGVRFVTEFFRADNSSSYWGLTLSQLISLVIATLALIPFLRRHKVATFANAPVGSAIGK
jgi:phosphatidylglycerol:prolipoprotein diacylglycerol transferase